MSSGDERENGATWVTALVNSLPDATLVISSHGEMLHCNQAFLDFWRFPEEILASASDAEALKWAAQQTIDPEGFLQRVSSMYETKSPSFREEIAMRDGRVLERNGSCIYFGESAVGWVWTFRDVSEQKCQESEIKTAAATKAAMLEAALDCVITINHEGIVREFNAAAERTFGYTRESVLGKELAMVIVPQELRDNHREGLRRYLDSGEARVLNRRIELPAMHASGRIFPIEISIVRLPITGPPVFTAYLRDISDRVEAEQRLKESEERFRDLADNIPQLAWIAESGTDGEVYWFNQNWFEYTGTTWEQMKGNGWQSVHHPEYVDQVVKNFAHHVRNGLDWEDTFPLRRNDGEYRWFLSRMKCIRDDEGNVVRIFGTNTDITQIRELEEHLRKLASELAESGKRKDEFMAMLAHELRNPLAPIRSAAELMKTGKAEAGNFGHLTDVINRQADHLVHLVNDLLDVSRLNLGKIVLKTERCDLFGIVSSAVEANKPLCDSFGHCIEVVEPPNPIYVNADPVRLTQVLTNLLNNACKFTDPQGTIHVQCEIADGMAVVRVKDSGIGIDPSHLPNVFETFRQLDNSLERSASGLGLGLSIVRHLVELHGGSVTAHSEGLGNGSLFVVKVPLAEAPTSAVVTDERPKEAASTPQLKVLVVDDNDDAAQVLEMMMQALGYETRTASDGIQAISQAQEFRPDLILMDIGLPKLNGYEACSRILEESWSEGMILVALTGWGQEEDRRRSMEAGFHEHLVKPIDMQTIRDLVTRQFAKE
ncbi:MAG: PAS domain S-box protein [Fimbriimonadaceae bacterium]|nr:PAS domain S-box protein [Fimbriimonadaceae bacterium]